VLVDLRDTAIHGDAFISAWQEAHDLSQLLTRWRATANWPGPVAAMGGIVRRRAGVALERTNRALTAWWPSRPTRCYPMPS